MLYFFSSFLCSLSFIFLLGGKGYPRLRHKACCHLSVVLIFVATGNFQSDIAASVVSTWKVAIYIGRVWCIPCWGADAWNIMVSWINSEDSFFYALSSMINYCAIFVSFSWRNVNALHLIFSCYHLFCEYFYVSVKEIDYETDGEWIWTWIDRLSFDYIFIAYSIHCNWS